MEKCHFKNDENLIFAIDIIANLGGLMRFFEKKWDTGDIAVKPELWCRQKFFEGEKKMTF